MDVASYQTIRKVSFHFPPLIDCDNWAFSESPDTFDKCDDDIGDISEGHMITLIWNTVHKLVYVGKFSLNDLAQRLVNLRGQPLEIKPL